MHTPGAQGLKSVHLAAKLCTPGAGCTLNFEHCQTQMQNLSRDMIMENRETAVFEIKELFHAPAECTGRQNNAPDYHLF